MDSQNENPLENSCVKKDKPKPIEINEIGDSNRVIVADGDIIVNRIIYSNPVEQPANIFISYARSDIKIVESIFKSLKNKKHHSPYG